jgi:Flp pilus assembly protein TadB
MKEERDILNSHSFWMALCCAIPLLGIVLLSLLGILGSWGLFALILLCPLLHFIFMSRMASRGLHKEAFPESNDGAVKTAKS